MNRKHPAPLREMSEFEFGYVIGILEGEGCFSIHKQYGRPPERKVYVYPKIEVQGSDRDTLEKMVEFTGIGKVTGPYKTRAKHHSPMFAWRMSSRESLNLMNKVLPFMSERRQERIREVIEETR